MVAKTLDDKVFNLTFSMRVDLPGCPCQVVCSDGVSDITILLAAEAHSINSLKRSFEILAGSVYAAGNKLLKDRNAQ